KKENDSISRTPTAKPTVTPPIPTATPAKPTVTLPKPTATPPKPTYTYPFNKIKADLWPGGIWDQILDMLTP
ncbi:MAG: hypothetical protein LBS61_00725, partial [Endomicrobium sp.]|nr:hypothetical protein [Endomicrobium sp.]